MLLLEEVKGENVIYTWCIIMEVHRSDSNHTASQLDFLSLVRSARTACHLQCHSAVVFNPLQLHIRVSKRNQAGHINAC